MRRGVREECGSVEGMKKLLFAVLAALVVCLSAPAVRADVLIQAQCSVLLAGSGTCTFTNTGDTPGSACATLTLRNRTNGASTSSSVACSGELKGSTSGQPVAIAIIGPTVVQTCDGPGATTINTFCDVSVQISNVRDLGRSNAGLFWFFVAIPSALFMYWDARRRMMPTPVQYLFGGLFLWIIAVPWFLIVRRKYPVGGGAIPPTAFHHVQR